MLRLALLLTLLTACASSVRREDPVLRLARARLGTPADDGRFLGAVLGTGHHLPPAAEGALDAAWLHALAQADHKLTPKPLPGALIFFAQSVRPFHAGVIERVDARGITFLHATRGRVRRGVCDTGHPAVRRDPRGRIANSYLLPRLPGDLPGTRYLCGELIAGYARF